MKNELGPAQYIIRSPKEAEKLMASGCPFCQLCIEHAERDKKSVLLRRIPIGKSFGSWDAVAVWE